MAITKFSYPQIQRWYNAERRDITPAWMDTRDNHNDITFYGNSLNKFTIDASNTDVNNPKTLTLYTYSNGVTIKMQYYRNGDNIYYSVAYFDENDSVIDLDNAGGNLRTWNSSVLSKSDKYNLTYDHFTFYYTPPQVWYLGEEAVTNPGVYNYKGQFFYLHDNDSPYDPPEIFAVNETFDRGNLGIYYDGLGGGIATISSDMEYNALIDAITENGDDTPITPILPSEDTSDPGGGDEANPDYNPFSDPVEFPGLPTGGSALATGFIRVYTPTASQLQSLASLLWSDSFVDTIKKVQNDPMEAIISLHSLPMSLSSGTAECRIGNFNTGITMNTPSSQYVKRDLGSIHIPEHWASALDYGPYNTIDIFLPYVGVRSLQVDDVIGKTLKVEYNVDILSGATVASIMCGNSVLYTYNTSLIAYHPISQSSFGPLYQSIAGAMGNVISGAVSGGIGGAVGGALGSAINVAMSKHSTVSRGGSIGANSGCLGNFVPYLIIHRPIQSLASGFAHFKGYPSNITATLGSVSGYTEVESVHLNGITCTDNEKAEIEALLYNGVIL